MSSPLDLSYLRKFWTLKGLSAGCVILVLAACSSPPPLSPPPIPLFGAPTLEETLHYANAIYLAQVERRDGGVHYRIREIWRETGPADMPISLHLVGDEVFERPGRRDHPGVTFGDAAVVTIFRPYLVQGGGQHIPEAAVSVEDGWIRAFGLSVKDLHARVLSTPWQPAPAAPTGQ